MKNFLLSGLQQHSEKILTLLDQVVVSGGNFLIGILLVRRLGLNTYGLFALYWMFTLFAASFQQAFILMGMITLIPKKPKYAKEIYLGTTLFYQLFFSLLAASVICIIATTTKILFPAWEIKYLEVLLPVTVFTYLMHNYFRKRFYALLQITQTVVIDVLAYSLQIFAILAAACLGQLSLQATFLFMAISFAISSGYGWLKHEKMVVTLPLLLLCLKENWNFSKWLLGTAILQWCSGNFFVIVAGGIIGPLAVGAIKIAQNIVGILNIFFQAFDNYITVKSALIFHKSGCKAFWVYVKKVMLIGGAITTLVLLGIAIGGRYIIKMLYGVEHLQYDYVLSGYTVVYGIFFCCMSLACVIRTMEKNRIIFTGYLCSSLFALVTAKPIVLKYNIMGVIIGMMATQLINLLCYIVYLKKETGCACAEMNAN